MSETKEPLPNKKILCIDDDPVHSNLIKRVLEANGYSVLLAPNGAKGLDQAHQEQPGLILLDVHLPGLNGYEVARRLREMEHTRHIPILAISTNGNTENKQLGHEVDDYIIKPIDIDLISRQIAAYL